MLFNNEHQNHNQEAGSCTCFLCVENVSGKVKSITEEKSIEERLNSLPKIKARPGFDQRIAAAFAIELENEIHRKNQSWLKKNRKILLPDLLPNNRS